MVEEYVNVHNSEWWRRRRRQAARGSGEVEEAEEEEGNSRLHTHAHTQQRGLEDEEWRGTFWVHNIYRSRHDSVAPHGDELQVLGWCLMNSAGGILPIVWSKLRCLAWFCLNPLKTTHMTMT